MAEEKQLAAARKGVKLSGTPDATTDRGRVVFFFVDDVHLTSDGLNRARSVITHFVENKMTAKDRVAVVLGKDGRFIKWSQALPLPPGLYQVRVAVRDRQTGRTGSAMMWIEIPNGGPTGMSHTPPNRRQSTPQ